MIKLKISNLSKTYKGSTSVLNNISFSVEEDDFLVVIGKSGCGKSTLLRCIAGLEIFQSGEVYLEDQLINDMSSKDRNISMIFQNYYLYPQYTIYQNLAFILLNQGYKRDEIDPLINNIATKFNLEDILAERPRTLSGGQRQKVALARVMLKNSSIALLDEPLSSIDEIQRITFIKELKEYHQKMHIPFIYVTHNQKEALSLATKIMLLDKGRIVSIASPKEMINNPNNLLTKEFFTNNYYNKIEAIVIDEESVKVLNNIINVNKMNNVTKEQKVILGINVENTLIGDKGLKMRVVHASNINDKFLVELNYNNSTFYAYSNKILYKDEEVYVDMFSGNIDVYDYHFKNKISGTSNEYIIPCPYLKKGNSYILDILNTKYELKDIYLDYILPFKKLYIKCTSNDFNNKDGIKLIGKVKEIVKDKILVAFNNYTIYFPYNNEKINDDYITYLDFDNLTLYNEEYNVISIACPITNNIDSNNKKVIDFKFSKKKEKDYKKVTPIYEECIGSKNIAFFKVKRDPNVYMCYINKKNSIYSKEYKYAKFIY